MGKAGSIRPSHLSSALQIACISWVPLRDSHLNRSFNAAFRFPYIGSGQCKSIHSWNFYLPPTYQRALFCIHSPKTSCSFFLKLMWRFQKLRRPTHTGEELYVWCDSPEVSNYVCAQIIRNRNCTTALNPNFYKIGRNCAVSKIPRSNRKALRRL